MLLITDDKSKGEIKTILHTFIDRIDLDNEKKANITIFMTCNQDFIVEINQHMAKSLAADAHAVGDINFPKSVVLIE